MINERSPGKCKAVFAVILFFRVGAAYGGKTEGRVDSALQTLSNDGIAS